MDERQKQVRGEIFTQACVGIIISMFVLIFLYEFEMIHFDLTVSEVLLNLVLLMVAYISSSLILRDAYFGIVSGNQMKACLCIFTLLAIALDALMIFDMLKGEGFSPVSISSLIMSNSIMVSLWYKRKSW